MFYCILNFFKFMGFGRYQIFLYPIDKHFFLRNFEILLNFELILSPTIFFFNEKKGILSDDLLHYEGNKQIKSKSKYW